ncbi:hypothetical protein K438DRAFT_1788279 [Mycena galopus ATCC 62051]|nr:hypothetical protein K438DRAFT_1788279 [Mycena galopus ATCC 62051]
MGSRTRQRGPLCSRIGVVGTWGGVVLSWDTAASTSPLFMQALGAPTASIAFEFDCVNSTSASFVDAATGLALTAWAAESGSAISPRETRGWDRKVTFETFNGRAAQVWTLRELD